MVCRAQTISSSGPTTFCQGDSVVLMAPAGTAYQWQFNLAPVATTRNFTARLSGSYTVTVTIAGVPVTTAPVVVTVNPNPVAAFSFSPSGQCSSVPVYFTDISTGTGLTYRWNFNDPASLADSVSAAQNPVHRFIGLYNAIAPTFQVKLTVTNSDGCSNSLIKAVAITKPNTQLNEVSLITFNNEPYFTKCATVASSFDFTYQPSPGSTNTAYKIIWGDNSPDFNSPVLTTVNHMYNVGFYQLKFIVTAQDGCKDTANYKVFVGTNPGGSLSNPSNTQGCTGDSFSFPFVTVSNNPLGTIYVVSVNDGSPTEVFNQPPPAFYTHTFKKSSCGVAGNFFTVSYTISNPCGFFPGSTGGIGISDKPKADFIFSPKDTTCVGTTVTVINKSPLVSNVNNNGTCTNGKLIWKITPATGWSNPGTLGNDNNNNTISGWTTGADQFNIVFTLPGVYTVKLKLGGNQACGVDSIIKTICVNPLPTAAFTVDTTIGCAPLKITTATTTNIPNCGQYTYKWTTSYTPTSGCASGTGNVTYLQGTSPLSREPVFQFTAPGVYTIGLVVIGAASACSTAIVQKQITVKGKPIIASLGIPTAICETQSVNPNPSVNCYVTADTSYVWSFTGGMPSASSIRNPGQVVYPAAGTFPVVLTATNSCGDTTVTQQLTVNPIPGLITPADTSYCAGSPTGPFVFISSLTGSTITWTNNNTAIGLGAGGSGNIGSFIAVNNTALPITANIRITAVRNGCAKQASFAITVYPKPAIPGVTPVINYCVGDSSTPLTASAVAGNTLLWYTTANGGVGDTIAPKPATNVAITVSYYVSQKNANGCESNRATITVNVWPKPAITSSSYTNPATCGSLNGTIILNGLAFSTTYSISYSINGGTPVPVTGTSNALGVLTLNLGAGTYSNIFVISGRGCPSNVVGPFTLTDPNPPPPPVAGANSPVCSGKTLTLTANPIATGTLSYSWTGPNNFSSMLRIAVINNVTTAASGTYYVTNKLNNCTSLADSVTVIIDSTPVTPVVTSNSPVCAGDTIKLSSKAYTFLVNYSWTGPNTFTSTLQNPFIANATVSASGSYTLIATPVTANCPSLPSAPVNVIVNPVPVISGATFTNPVNCGSPSGTIVLNGLTPATSYTVLYTNAAGMPITLSTMSDATGFLTIGGLISGSYSNIRVSLKDCSSNTVGPFTLSDPNPPAAPVAGGNTPLCTGDTLKLTSLYNPNSGVLYTWNGPGFSSNLQNPSINNVSTAQSGKYFVTVTLNNCTSFADSITVIINPKPDVPTVSANSPVCSGDTIKLTASNASAGMITYAWTGPNNFSSNLQNPFIANAGLNQAGVYGVTATQANCSAVSPATVAVTVRSKPAISASSYTDPTSCGSSTGTITLQGLTPATSYSLQYTYNGGTPSIIPVVSNPVGVIVLNNLPSGLYSQVSVAFNGCSSIPAGPFTLTDLPPLAPSAASNGPLCVGSTLHLTSAVALPGAVTYSWFGPGGFSSNLQNPVIPITALANSGTYTLTATMNGCSAFATINVVVFPKAVGGYTSADSTVCMGTNNGTIQLTGYTGTIGRWQFSVDNGATWNTINNTTPLLAYTNLAVSTWYRAVIESGVCPSALSDTTKITVVNQVDPAIAGPDQTLCNQQSVNLSANNPVIGKGFWTQPPGQNAVIANPASPNTSATLLQPANTYRFIWTITGATGCGSSLDDVQIINRPAITAANAGADTAICDFTTARTVTLHANADVTRPFEKGSWSIISQPATGAGILNNPANPASVFTITQAGIYRLVWTISNDVAAACGISVDTITINVSNKPVAGFSVTPVQLCTGQSVTVSNTSLNTNVYKWYWGNGDSASFANGTYSYTTPGSFTITLVASRLQLSAVCTDTARQRVTVLNKIPAQINVTPGKPCVPYNLQLSAGNASGASLIEWKIFDQAISPGFFYATGPTASHTYNFAGSDSARLIVYNQNGCADSTTYRFNVFSVPVTTFTPLSLSACSHDTTILFKALTAYSASDPVNYRWFINDQLKGNSNPFNYRFQTVPTNTMPVVYNVKVLAQNTGGCGDTSLTAKLSILPLPAAGIKVTPSFIQQQPDYTFTFEDTTSSTSFKNYLWSMGDRSLQTKSGKKVTYQYSDTGTYQVKLKTTDFSTGCGNSDSVKVTILYVPGYLQVPNAVCLGCSNNALRRFLPLGKGLSYYRLRIYTTWGQVIFESSLLNPDGSPKEAWTGQYNGKPVEQDAYRWEIEARYTNGTEWKGMFYPGRCQTR